MTKQEVHVSVILFTIALVIAFIFATSAVLQMFL